MTYVRSHYRRDGTFVKGHTRRTRPRAAQPYAARGRATPRRTPVPRPRPVRTGPTTYVGPYYRADGTRVRGHHRSISPRTVAVAAGSGLGFIILILVLLALASGSGDSGKTPSGAKPSHSTSAPASQHR
ncbi:hypothetical protein AB0L85_19180 [Streptomyces sp. NPDC052051]|uniref:hypothetical protein n=1 Tax=Streptomyces sp. NPDC052051 TaxID=3154649 RepID=UPI003437C638